MNSKTVTILAAGTTLLLALWLTGGEAGSLRAADLTQTTGAADAAAVVGSNVGYQGYLTESGTPVSGLRTFTFRLFTDSACTTAASDDIVVPAVQVKDGNFATAAPIDAATFNGQALWLRVQVSSVTLGCREILATPYALGLRPGAQIVNSDLTLPYNGAALVVLNNGGRGIFVEKNGDQGAAGYFVSQSERSGVYGESAGGFGGRLGGHSGLLTQAQSGPGVLVSDSSGISTTFTAGPGDLVASGDLIADGSLGLGAPGVNGNIFVHDAADRDVFGFTAGNALLKLGGAGEDGDFFMLDGVGGRRLELDGGTGRFTIYNGAGVSNTNKLLAFEVNGVSSSIVGSRVNADADLAIRSNDNLDFFLNVDNSADIGRLTVRDPGGVARLSLDQYGNLSTAGSLIVSGNFQVFGGSKSAVVATQSYGQRLLYAVESPENWFEDFGSSQLTDGAATIAIDPIFAQTVNLSLDYKVFVTPVDGWAGLYVSDKTPTSFVVRAADGQANIAFDYRIVAKRLGFEQVRLAQSELPQMGDAGEQSIVMAASTEVNQEEPSPTSSDVLGVALPLPTPSAGQD